MFYSSMRMKIALLRLLAAVICSASFTSPALEGKQTVCYMVYCEVVHNHIISEHLLKRTDAELLATLHDKEFHNKRKCAKVTTSDCL